VQECCALLLEDVAGYNDYIIPVEHPVWGKIKVLGFPWTFRETPGLGEKRGA